MASLAGKGLPHCLDQLYIITASRTHRNTQVFWAQDEIQSTCRGREKQNSPDQNKDEKFVRTPADDCIFAFGISFDGAISFYRVQQQILAPIEWPRPPFNDGPRSEVLLMPL
jgi:hypothetical protein